MNSLNKRLRAALLATIGSLLVGSGILPAAPISTLFSTGVDAAGIPLLGGDGTADSHYSVISGPGIGAPVGAVTYKHPAYFADGPASRWISSNATGGGGAGSYVFRTTFSLAGFDPTATSISVSCATDNSLAGVALNGAAVAGACTGFGAFSPPFVIGSGFVAGLNTLDFTVFDAGPPMGFRAQYTSDTAPLGAVPEPTSIGLAGLGIAVVALRKKLTA